jgi:hypothetical protein
MALDPARAVNAARFATRAAAAGRPFMGMIDAVIVEGNADHVFAGAIAREHAVAAWTWVVRDLGPDLIDVERVDDDPRNLEALESLVPDLLARAKTALAEAMTNPEANRRIKTQLASEAAWDRLPFVLNALRCRALLDKAQGFGRAANGMADDASLALALQSMPLADAAVAAFLMQAMVGQVAAPARLVMAAIRITGAASETALTRAGYGPLIDAILAHAQSQIPALSQSGQFADMDLVCRSVDRFHRLIRAVTGYVELNRAGHWASAAAALTKEASTLIEPKLRDVAGDLNKALRRRDGADRLDSDTMLSALNGVFLLATIRDSRDSLALNALFDQVWSQTGQALEIHIERLLAQVRANPTDKIASARLEAALKMAEVRFNQDYADTLRRAKEAAERRVS